MVKALTLFMPSLSMIFLRCVMTVASPMFSLSAISLLMKPCTMSDITSISRSLSIFRFRISGMGGICSPCPWACCWSIRIARTSSFSGILIQRQWKSASCDMGSSDRVRTMVLRLCASKKALFSSTMFIDVK